MTYLDGQFGVRLISRKHRRGRGWPPRSPDLNVCDFFLWGYLKSRCYTPKPRNLDELEANIRREVGLLDPAMITRALLDDRARAHRCIAAGGFHFE